MQAIRGHKFNSWPQLHQHSIKISALNVVPTQKRPSNGDDDDDAEDYYKTIPNQPALIPSDRIIMRSIRSAANLRKCLLNATPTPTPTSTPTATTTARALPGCEPREAHATCACRWYLHQYGGVCYSGAWRPLLVVKQITYMIFMWQMSLRCCRWWDSLAGEFGAWLALASLLRFVSFWAQSWTWT